MVVDNSVVSDTRVRKEAIALAAAGYRVTVIGKAEDGVPSEENLGGAVIVRVPVVPTVLDELWDRRMRRRQRRIPLVGYRSRRAYDAARRRIQARRRDVSATAGRTAASREAGLLTRRRRWLGSVGRRRQLTQLAVKELVVRARGVSRHRMNRAFGAFWQAWDGMMSNRQRGARWRRVLPGLDDFEVVYGPVIDDLDPDVIHAHDVFSIGVGARAVARARLAGRNALFVYDAHEFVPGLPKNANRSPRYAAAIEDLEREYIYDADRIITVSPAIAEAIETHYGLKRRPITVLNAPMLTDTPPGPSGRSEVRAVSGVPRGAPLLVYSGGLKKVRGIDVAVQALVHLPGVHLAVVCVPHSRAALVGEMKIHAEERGVADRVHFVDPVPSDRVVGFLASADVGVHPMLGGIANHEMALPNKLFEYLHAGLPMVVTDLRVLGAFVRQHGLGETFPSGDPVGLAAGIEKVLADPKPYRKAARDPALLAEYRWERQAEALVGVYAELLDG
jgi:glycosyltransferase involved in cell wall biosynthesis